MKNVVTLAETIGERGTAAIGDNLAEYRQVGDETFTPAFARYYRAGMLAKKAPFPALRNQLGTEISTTAQRAAYDAGMADAARFGTALPDTVNTTGIPAEQGFSPGVNTAVANEADKGYNGKKTEYTLDEAVRQLGRNGSRALSAYYSDGLTPDTDTNTHPAAYANEFLRYYEAGKQGAPQESVTPQNYTITPAQKAAAYFSGMNDAAEANAGGIGSKDSNRGTEGAGNTNIKELIASDKPFNEKINDYAKKYAINVNSNEDWSWNKSFENGDQLSIKQKRLIKERAVNNGYIPDIKVTKVDGMRYGYADFNSTGIVRKTAYLPENMWKLSDPEQFEWLDAQMDGHVDGYTWHHTEIRGKMELVPTGIHNITTHNGGRTTGMWADAPRKVIKEEVE